MQTRPDRESWPHHQPISRVEESCLTNHASTGVSSFYASSASSGCDLELALLHISFSPSGCKTRLLLHQRPVVQLLLLPALLRKLLGTICLFLRVRLLQRHPRRSSIVRLLSCASHALPPSFSWLPLTPLPSYPLFLSSPYLPLPDFVDPLSCIIPFGVSGLG